MLKIKNLRGECQHCGKPIEFHAEHAGTSAECPHCSQQTELFLGSPAEEGSPVRRKAIIFAVIALLILGAGVVALGMLLKRAKERAKPVPPVVVAGVATTDPFAPQGFRVSAVALEQGKGQGSSLIYAAGTITNATNRQRFGLKVELELSDATGKKLGVATDYCKVLEPNAQWKYRALVVDKRATAAKVAAINESQ